ncbi:MAG: hypothetical protein QOH61_1888 [Chloroflexota bacterium]|nr:hypothetical protein [Chloroflexota bacterium]
MTTQPSAPPRDRSALMAEHAEAKRRREAAPLGSDAYRVASEDVARIEVAIAALEEPPPTIPLG